MGRRWWTTCNLQQLRLLYQLLIEEPATLCCCCCMCHAPPFLAVHASWWWGLWLRLWRQQQPDLGCARIRGEHSMHVCRTFDLLLPFCLLAICSD